VSHHILVQGFHLGFAPVKLCLPFQIRQLPAHKPHDAGVMHPRDDVPGGIVDGVERRHHFAALKGQFRFRRDALPAVEDVQPTETARLDAVGVQRLGKIGLPGNQDQPGGTAVQTAPFQSGGNAPTQTCAPFNSTQSFQLIGSGILEVVPLPQHVVHQQGYDVLHHPVLPVQAVEQRIVACHAGEGIACGFQRTLAAVTQPEQRV